MACCMHCTALHTRHACTNHVLGFCMQDLSHTSVLCYCKIMYDAYTHADVSPDIEHSHQIQCFALVQTYSTVRMATWVIPKDSISGADHAMCFRQCSASTDSVMCNKTAVYVPSKLGSVARQDLDDLLLLLLPFCSQHVLLCSCIFRSLKSPHFCLLQDEVFQCGSQVCTQALSENVRTKTL